LHARLFVVNAGGRTVIVVLEDATAMAYPSTDAAFAWLMEIVPFVSVENRESCRLAITPSATVLAFRPVARDAYVPPPPVQLRVFEATVSAGPALAAIVEMLGAG